MTTGRRVIPIAAPPAPQCYSSRAQWVEYLCEAQKHFKPERRPFVGEAFEYRANFCFCKDCEPIHRADMEDKGRCQFEQYVEQRAAAQQGGTHATTV